MNRSPVPELSTSNPAKVVLPDIDADGSVPEVFITSRVAKGKLVPRPNLLFVLSNRINL